MDTGGVFSDEFRCRLISCAKWLSQLARRTLVARAACSTLGNGAAVVRASYARNGCREGKPGPFRRSLCNVAAIGFNSGHSTMVGSAYPRDAKTEPMGVMRTIARMKERLDGSELNIDELSAVAKLSTFYFMRSFRATTGMKRALVSRPLRLFAAQKACRRRRRSSSGDQLRLLSYLARYFKSSFGVTPGQ